MGSAKADPLTTGDGFAVEVVELDTALEDVAAAVVVAVVGDETARLDELTATDDVDGCAAAVVDACVCRTVLLVCSVSARCDAECFAVVGACRCGTEETDVPCAGFCVVPPSSRYPAPITMASSAAPASKNGRLVNVWPRRRRSVIGSGAGTN